MNTRIVAVMIKWLESDCSYIYKTVAGASWRECNELFTQETANTTVVEKIEGFMTSDGIFVDEYDAYDIAREAGQLDKSYWTPAPNREKLEDYMIIWG